MMNESQDSFATHSDYIGPPKVDSLDCWRFVSFEPTSCVCSPCINIISVHAGIRSLTLGQNVGAGVGVIDRIERFYFMGVFNHMCLYQCCACVICFLPVAKGIDTWWVDHIYKNVQGYMYKY